MYVLVANAGSSSLKLRLLDPADQVVSTVDLDGSAGPADIAGFAAGLSQVDAVGHRIVHGGREFSGPVRIEGGVRDRIAALAELAPLHQPKGVAGIDAVGAALPDLPAVACFDTAFHHDLPAAAATYALPAEWNERYGLRRYGFHGLSHAYVARRAARLVGQDGPRIVSCHLGAGASLAAIAGGRSVDTTMGFTPLEGLVMATRSGSVDPGLLLWLLRHAGLGADELDDALEHRSGLAGLAGTADLREIIATGHPAFEVYTHRLRREIGAMAAALDGLDVLVFTGGAGEHSPPLRAAAELGHLGVKIDPERNATASGDADISAAGATVRTLVIAAREDLEIARQTRAVLT
jgi:acetate kinase